MDNFKKQYKNYIVVQFTGGNHAINISNGGNPKNAIMVKDYPLKLVNDFVDRFKQKYRDKYQIVNAGIPKYEGVKGTLNFGQVDEKTGEML